MKKSLLSIAVLLCTFGATRAQAQVSDVNFIVSPSLGYTMWNSNLNLGNTATYGARVGFGFGPILELRAASISNPPSTTSVGRPRTIWPPMLKTPK